LRAAKATGTAAIFTFPFTISGTIMQTNNQTFHQTNNQTYARTTLLTSARTYCRTYLTTLRTTFAKESSASLKLGGDSELSDSRCNTTGRAGEKARMLFSRLRQKAARFKVLGRVAQRMADSFAPPEELTTGPQFHNLSSMHHGVA
jgi:hypothetical protein